MKDTEIIQKLQKQYIETQQKLSKMNELIIRNNKNNNYLSDKLHCRSNIATAYFL